jgi:nucleoporin SEH1
MKGYRILIVPIGDLLVTTGDDATIRTWKKNVNGHWREYCEFETDHEN